MEAKDEEYSHTFVKDFAKLTGYESVNRDGTHSGVEEVMVYDISEKPASPDNLECGGCCNQSDFSGSCSESVGSGIILYRKKRTQIAHGLILLLLTVYFVAAMLINPTNRYASLLVAIYSFISLKIVFHHVSTRIVTVPLSVVWRNVVEKPVSFIPPRLKYVVLYGAFLLVELGFILYTPESKVGTRMQRLVSLTGIFSMIGLLYVTSASRKHINWHTVIRGIIIQFILGVFTLKTQFGNRVFAGLAELVSGFLDWSKEGAAFVLGQDTVDNVHIFVVLVLPGVIFFASFVQVVYYLGWMQWIIRKFAWVMIRLMDTSGSESVVAAASPFIGQGESALLVKPFLEYMTDSELHSIMTSGFATIAGSIIVAFLNMGIDGKSIITACVMSTPCSLALSKVRVPETEHSISKGAVDIPESKDKEANVLHAAANGAAQGMHLASLITGSLLAIISLYRFIDALFVWFWSFLRPPVPISLELVFSYVFWPFAVMLGVPLQECLRVGQLLGIKTTVNEFVAYATLNDMVKDPVNPLSERAYTLSVYALCGFANIASIGIQIGCLGAMAPSRRKDLAKLAVSAMLTGALCTMLSAAIAGTLL